jgi:hypothetical protein
VERGENPRLADRCCDGVAVHVGPQVRIDARKDHAHPLARQVVDQIADGLIYLRVPTWTILSLVP